MTKPPPEVQAQIAALPRNDPGRGPDLLHVTLISLYDLHYAPPEWLPATIAALDTFVAAPFPLRFDRIENRKAVTLRTRGPLAGARAFREAPGRRRGFSALTSHPRKNAFLHCSAMLQTGG
ncbi:hypothetical protein [Sphingopyxis sp. H115]|uniref:hypothetical protein n=1 Tax=Sphingopyxis sp. H115 TaxID=1759073 RepID=UPI0007376197|nr:hypothetical protein [Sphingopyxis sp. H115]KTE10069.1 hypothetical protein ATE71_12380 [Sphingopyxis sp. H115]